MNAVLPDVLVPNASPTPPTNGPQREVMTAEKLNSIVETASRCAEDPLFDEWVEAVAEYRRRNNSVPDAE